MPRPRPDWRLLAWLLWLLPALAIAAAKPLQVEQVVGRLHAGAPALAVSVSDPLDPARSYDEYLSVYRDGLPVEGAWVVDLNRHVLYFPHVEPDTQYRVLVRRGLTAANGRTLPAHLEAEARTPAMEPQYRFASSGNVIPARLGGGLPIETVNVPRVDIEFLRVPPGQTDDVAAMLAGGTVLGRWQLEQLEGKAQSVFLGRFETGVEANRRGITNIPVSDIEPLQRPGFYLAVMSAPGTFRYEDQAAFFYVSDIGLHVRRYENGRVAVFANGLAGGEPLADVRLSLLDKDGAELAAAFSDAAGHAELATARDARLVLASRGEHVAFVYLGGPALDLSAFAVDGRRQRPLEVFAYAPRDLYRPGETLYLSALLRDGDGQATAPMPLNLRLYRADGRPAAELVLPAQALGSYQYAYTIPADAPVGRWSAEFRVDPGRPEAAHSFEFLVEEFLPERMSLRLESEAQWLLAGEPFSVAVEGAYLYGAPAAGNRLHATLSLGRALHPFPNLDDVHFGNPDDDSPRVDREVVDTSLDGEGRFTLELNPVEQSADSPLHARVNVELYEPGGRPVTRSLKQVIWPGPALVGVRPLFEDDTAPEGGRARFELVRVDRDGRPLAAEGLQVQVIREEREYFWAYDEGRGWRRDYTQTAYPVLRREVGFAAGERAALAVPVEWGRYRVDVFDPGTGLTTRYRFEAGWSGDRDAAAAPDKVELRLDRAAYRGGETARLTLLPPHPGQALVTVEGDGLLWMQQVEVPAEGVSVAIPVDPAWQRHDLYVSAVVLRGAAASDKATPARAVGVLHLPLDRSPRRLAVELEAPDKMQPERPLTVSVHVPDAAGREAQVTVAAVDVGVLNVTGFESPDPFAWYFARRRYGVDQHDLYQKVIERMEGARAGLNYGGDTDTGGLRSSGKAQAEVKIASLFSGPVSLDSEGRAHVELPLPDFNGRLRLMAVAYTGDAFGSAEREVTVRAPVVAELAMPRFLGSGDEALATLELHNLSGEAQQLDVRLSANGPVTLADGEGQTLHLADGERRALRYGLRGEPALGVGVLVLAVSGEGLAIDRRWELAVRPALPGTSRAERLALEPGQRFFAGGEWSEGLMAATVDARLLLSASPPFDLAGLLGELLDYPYGCAEQTTSGAFPLLYADAAAQARFGLRKLSDTKRRDWVLEAVGRLVGKQRYDGGFALWGSDGPADPWLTAYVGHFLVEAKRLDYPLPPQMLENALQQLARDVEAGTAFTVQERAEDAATRFAGRAYAGYVLALAGRAPLGTLRTLFDHHREEAGSGLPLMQLAAALKLAGDAPRASAAVDAALARERAAEGYIGDYGSALRDSAAMAYLARRHGLGGAGALLLKTADELRERRWLSTQERNMLFLVGLEQPPTDAWSAGIAVGDAAESVEHEGRLQRPLAAEDLAAGVTVENRGEASLYLALEVNGYPRQAPTPTETIRLERRLLNGEGEVLPDSPLAVGQLVVAHTRIVSDVDLPNGLLVDLLPAGLELENQNLRYARSLAELPIPGAGEAEQDRRVQHREFRDDRFAAAFDLHRGDSIDLFYLLRAVTPGSYDWPAPTVEDMYRPERRGVGSGAREVRVEDRVGGRQ